MEQTQQQHTQNDCLAKKFECQLQDHRLCVQADVETGQDIKVCWSLGERAVVQEWHLHLQHSKNPGCPEVSQNGTSNSNNHTPVSHSVHCPEFLPLRSLVLRLVQRARCCPWCCKGVATGHDRHCLQTDQLPVTKHTMTL